MKLITKAIEKQLVKAYQDDPAGEKEQTVFVKLFYPAGAATWYFVAMDPEDKRLFGWADLTGDTGEWGWTALSELEAFTGKFGLKIERDLYFKPCLVKDCKELQRMMKGV